MDGQEGGCRGPSFEKSIERVHVDKLLHDCETYTYLAYLNR